MYMIHIDEISIMYNRIYTTVWLDTIRSLVMSSINDSKKELFLEFTSLSLSFFSSSSCFS